MRLPTFAELAPQVLRARSAFAYARRPPHIETPGPGRESVWDYPRPPRVEAVTEPVCIEFAGVTIAQTTRALRVLETAGAPVYYLPLADVVPGVLQATDDLSLCEWKGVGQYYDVVAGGRTARHAAWRYPEPFTDLGCGYEQLADMIAFYAGKMDACLVGEERARPQPGGFYGGWVLDRVVGPIKGEPGSEGW